MTRGNKAAQASHSPSRMLSHQQKHCLAQDAPWLGCARDMLGLGLLLAAGTGTGMGHRREQLSQRPLTPEPSWQEWGSDKGWQSLVCPCQTPEQTPPGEDTNAAGDKAGNPRPTGHSRFLLVTRFTPQSQGRLTSLTSPSLTLKR